MTPLRHRLYLASLLISGMLLLGAYLYSLGESRYGKEWTTHGWPAAVLQLSYLLALLATGLAFAGTRWPRVAGILLGLFALVVWIQTGFYE